MITPYSAQKSLIHQLNDERSTEAIASSATKSVKSDVAGGPPAKPTDTKLNELTVVSITESQGELSLHLSYMTYTLFGITFPLLSPGDEYGYVILSTVRSQPVEEIENHDLVQPDRRWLRDHLGFLTDSHEINVGITRAKYGLIIIGMCQHVVLFVKCDLALLSIRQNRKTLQLCLLRTCMSIRTMTVYVFCVHVYTYNLETFTNIQ